jgi:FlaA1/EpsC-like NDP-sugar epimerase
VQGLNIAVASSDGQCQMASQSHYEFSNKVVLITGSSGSVGSRVLDFFTSHGATTIGTYLDDKNTNTTLSKLNP